MRISDWSSDVCSSDLRQEVRSAEGRRYGPSRRSQGADLHRWWQGAWPACPHLRPLAEQEDPHPRPEDGLERQGEGRSEEHTSELQSLMRISYAVFCLKKKRQQRQYN